MKVITMTASRLGPGAFETISGHVVNVALIAITARMPVNDHCFAGVDVSSAKQPEEKAARLRSDENSELVLLLQSGQLSNPDSVITFSSAHGSAMLNEFAVGLVGILNGDSERFEKMFWELPNKGKRWEFEQSTPDSTCHYGGREKAILWDGGDGELRAFARSVRERLHDADYRGNQAWGKWGVAVKQIGDLPVSLYNGDKFDTNVAVVLPKDPSHLPAIWAYCSSADYVKAVRTINQTLNVTNASLVKVPFDLAHWETVAKERYPNGLPEPESDDPTQWIFHGRPEHSTSPLQVATARLLGYRWPAEIEKDIRLPEKQQTTLYESYWSKLESLFRGSEGTFDAFLRDYLAFKIKASKQEKADEVYQDFRRNFASLQEASGGLESLLAEMLRFGRYHAAFSIGSPLVPELADDLARLRRLVDVPALIIMRLFDCHDRCKTLSTGAFSDAIHAIEGYVFRRAICGEQTRSYWQIFASLAYRVEETAPLRDLKVGLARLRDAYRFPSDADFRRELLLRDIYGLRVCGYLLERLENHGSKEPTNTSGYTIEHILPQNDKLPEEWQAMLGKEWKKVQATWLHRLGNLTLTG